MKKQGLTFIIITLSVLFSSSSFAVKDEAFLRSMQAQIKQLEDMGMELPDEMKKMKKQIEEDLKHSDGKSTLKPNYFDSSGNSNLKDCNQYDDIQISSFCYNANTYYQEYISVAGVNKSQAQIEQAYQNHVKSAKYAIDVIKNYMKH